MKKLLISAILTWCASSMAFAQVSSIDSVKVNERVFNDIPTSILTTTSNYPSLVAFQDQRVSAASGFANRHAWRFSNDAGATPYTFTNDSFFDVFMEVTLTGDPASPRKEAGFLLDTIGGQGQFIVNTDGHEVVVFGGPLPFYAFPATFNSGDTISMGMTYFLDPVTLKRSVIYRAGGLTSPTLPFTNLEQGIIDGSTLGGYFQIVNDPSNPANAGSASFANITIAPARPVPEVGSLALSAIGLVSVFGLRRRRA